MVIEISNKEPDNRGKQEVIRDGQGRFIKGSSGNPSGRPGIPAELRQYAKTAPDKLIAIAEDEATPIKVRSDIYKWFAEMAFGKPGQQVAVSGDINNNAVTVVRFEGELAQWAK